MPIVVKDYTWTQSESKLCINLPLKGTKSTNIDVLSSLEYCKLSYPPFLFECWFYDKVTDANCVAIVSNGIISLQFFKFKEATWPQLFHPEHDNKELLKQIREEAIVYAGEREKQKIEQKKADAEANKKIALKQQMKYEEDERASINNVKETERRKATEEIESFKNEKKLLTIKPKIVITDKDIFKNDDVYLPIATTVKVVKETPQPRSNGNIQIKFTPREFPTPSRESQEIQEKEWLEKQALGRKMTELPSDVQDLTDDEKNLDHLKEKAANYFRQENYQVAVGVYNHAIRLFPKVAALYSNRAACHYKVRNLFKCIEDCTRALDLLTPPVDLNAVSRLKAHIRRGSAFCDLELYAEGLLDYEAAIRIQPANQEILNDAENIRKIIVGLPPEKNEKIEYIN